MVTAAEVPCERCGGTRQIVIRGPVSDVDGDEVWIQVDLEPCPDCGNDDLVDPPKGAV